MYDLDVIDGQVTALQAALPARADLAYAVKANPALAVVAHLARLGLGADVASGGELQLALRAGMDPSRIVMTGPGKRGEELAAAVAARVRAVTVESIGELDRLGSIARAAGVRQPIMLRSAVAADRGHERTRLVGDAGAGKFGMDRADLARAARRAARSPDLALLGIHAFGASNVLDADSLIAHLEATSAIAHEIAATAGVRLEIVDVGGGLGIPYQPGDAPLDLAALARGIRSVMATWSADPWLAGARLLLEPGRFIVGPAGTYVARVVDTKTVDGRPVAILDGGVHHLLRPALVRTEHRVRSLTAPDRPCTVTTIAGPLCSGLDILATDALIPAAAVGDLIAVTDVGAYGFTESMPLFLSHPMPAEVLARNGTAACIRPRVEPSAWLDQQIVPDLR